MSAIDDPVAVFTGHDGATHRIGVLQATNNAGGLLIDEWEGHGLRVLCLLSLRDDSRSQIEAVIREYRVEASCSDRPLSRRVEPAELASSPQRTPSLI